jgi:large subunit ribosomal protein L24
MKIKKGDTVKILYGKDRGRQGNVVAVDIKNSKVVVDGINIYKKHVKGDGKSKKSEIVTIVKPLDVSKIMLMCPNCNKAVRVNIERKKDKVQRVCKKCKKVIEVLEQKESKKAEQKVSIKKKSEKKLKAKKSEENSSNNSKK